MRPFLIDTDAGSDDAVALVMALRHRAIETKAITVVAGNVPLESAVQNALFVCELCEREVPVHAGADGPLERRLETAQHIHGSDGFGDIGLDLKGRRPAAENAVRAIVRTAAAHEGELEIVTLGPLTNLALALREDPGLSGRVRRCVVMGGTGRGPGNITPVAEFNIWVDPEAAQIVFDSDLEIELVGWDISIAHALFDPAQARLLRDIGGTFAEFCIDIQNTLDTFQTTKMGIRGFDLPDAIAMAIALDPEVATDRRRYHVEIETTSELCRGQTVIDRFGVRGLEPNAEIIGAADRPRFLELLEAALRP
jgi:purine nucleosidase